MASDQKAFDLQPLLRLLWRGRFILLLGALIGTAGFGYYALIVAKPVYRATTIVILETRTGEIADIQAVLTGLTGELPEINTEIEVLRGRMLMGQVVDILNLTADPEFNGALVPDGWQIRIKHRLRSWIMAEDPAPRRLEWEREAAINALISHVSVSAVPSSFVFRITAQSRSV
jgi:polysaccharide biosynthesis transport protein